MKTITTQIMVIPDDGNLLSEQATTIGLADAGAGAFVVLRQPENANVPPEYSISIDAREWPAIRVGIEKMLAIAEGIEAETLGDGDNALGIVGD
jgi:hypothetical protein